MAKTILLNFLKGILAGLSIGLGGFLYILMAFALKDDVAELGKILGSILFAVGLFLVCTFKFSLYTGKIGTVYEGKQEASYYISLPVMLIGNAIGAFGLGYLCYFIFKDTSMMDTVYAACSLRTALNNFNDYLATIVKGILCGVCVYLAVKCFNLNRLKPLGIALLVFFVFLFVYCGFQHCIANMFYFGFGNHINENMFINLALVIVANSVGPIVGVGMSKLFEKKTA